MKAMMTDGPNAPLFSNASLRVRGGGCGGSKPLAAVPMKALRKDKLAEVDLSGKGLGPKEALVLGEVMKSSRKLVACNRPARSPLACAVLDLGGDAVA